MFVHAYKPQVVNINDSINFEVSEAWCERTYIPKDIKALKKDKKFINYRIVLALEDNFITKNKGFKKYWNFEDLLLQSRKDSCILESYKGKLYTLKPLKDTLEIRLNYRTPPNSNEVYWSKHHLGSFYLIKEDSVD